MRDRALLLFDIDGTLLRGANEAHRDALYAALTAEYGIADPAAYPIDPAGRTDLDIARQVLLAAGVGPDRIAAGFGAFQRRACLEYAERCPADLSGRRVAGMAALLERLAGRDDVVLSLVTGNLEPIARLKLDRAGVGRFFAPGQGGFGSDDERRGALPGIARARAGVDGRPHPRERTWVIGDTPRDVACARADGVRCLGVTTGPFGREALAGADGVAGDAEALGALLAAELG